MVETQYREHLPHVELRDAITCYWSLRSDGVLLSPSEPRRVLPDGCIDIIFNLGDPLRRLESGRASINRLPWYVVGAMTRPVDVQTTGKVDIIGVRFRPGYAKLFLISPARDFTDQTPALQDVWGRNGAVLGAKLAELDSLQDRVRVLDEALLQRHRQAEKPSVAVKLAVTTLLRSGGQARVAQLASQCGITTRHLGRQFEEAVGLSPKLFARVVRFQKALSSAKESKSLDWLTFVFEAGYYDQSHMIKDFREFAHSSPSRLP